ncbi:MAG TPA: NADH-quinone oxidoreductase subunit C [Acidimicrobiia bacterium]|nr:NADH-quinone oxidoreductase subunit C [Acidimicrobiia bacterium]
MTDAGDSREAEAQAEAGDSREAEAKAETELPPGAGSPEGDEIPIVEPEPDPEPEPLPEEAAKLLAQLEKELKDSIIESGHTFGDLVVRVAPEAWRKAAEVARDKLECDYLSFVSGIDWMPAPKVGGDDAGGDTSSPVQPTEITFGIAGSDGRFQVFARVQSTARHHGFTLKVDVDEDTFSVPSWVPVYPGADWHERETWEMFGIGFDGHPGMRHLYLPFEFEGHPLRKDYPLLSREIKPWPGLVDVEPMPGEEASEEGGGE